MTYIIPIRKKRQATIPKAVMKQLGVEEGDSIVINFKNNQALLTSSKQEAMDALKAIQEAFTKSGITEAEFLSFAEANRYSGN